MESRYLKLAADTPLPCGHVRDGQLCGRPVLRVLANTMLRQGDQDQAWRAVAICDECLAEVTRQRETPAGPAEDDGNAERQP